MAGNSEDDARVLNASGLEGSENQEDGDGGMRSGSNVQVDMGVADQSLQEEETENGQDSGGSNLDVGGAGGISQEEETEDGEDSDGSCTSHSEDEGDDNVNSNMATAQARQATGWMRLRGKGNQMDPQQRRALIRAFLAEEPEDIETVATNLIVHDLRIKNKLLGVAANEHALRLLEERDELEARLEESRQELERALIEQQDLEQALAQTNVVTDRLAQSVEVVDERDDGGDDEGDDGEDDEGDDE
ncbi:hypothetical protein NHQ30_005060 [Ciborinia camelliae]|nr:hypothetical protein NHQ30_005060 [Ciborinia camelliae]